MSGRFVHLRLHTEYSLIDSVVRVEPLMEAVASAGMPAVALTDQNNLFAMVKFYRAALAHGVKPLIGVDLLVREGTEREPPSRLTLMCQSQSGYRNVTRLVSRAYLEGQQRGVPMIERAWLTLESLEGLIGLSGAAEGDVGRALANGRESEAEAALARWLALLPDRYYIELQRLGRPGEEAYIAAAVALAARRGVPVVATNDVRFLKREDFESHEARVCIHEGAQLADPGRPRRYSPEQYLRTPGQMAELFADIPEALANTVEVARRASLVLDLGRPRLPPYPVPGDMSTEEYLRAEAAAGLKRRLEGFARAAAPVDLEVYQQRLARELEVICQMGFAGYFLIVADFIRWARGNGVPVGPGRGSGAGSLVAYCLGITDLDPLRYDLLFERFLNPERVSMPDFDIDFCMEGRDRVIEYVAQRYGRERVSQIITYGTMAAKAVVRDVGRVLGMSYGYVDKIAKLIPFELGITLDEALEKEPELNKLYEGEEEVRTLIDLARSLEGLTRNAGMHAGGVVIAPSVLTDFAPLYCDENGGSLVTQFDKDDVEAAGLVKFDFLGLRTLTIIDWTVKAINALRAQSGEAPFDIASIPLDDAPTYENVLKRAQTVAVFQFESSGMQRLLKDARPDRFEDLIALIALFRPGPMELIPEYVACKHGKQPEYLHPEMRQVLAVTYGVFVYQEQVMQIAQRLAGYTLGGADLLRRAMGKKKPEEMAKHRGIFAEGAAKNGIAPEKANEIFDLMEKFAGYGFNKSHAAAYALLAVQTAWLKAHYPAEFMAANMSIALDDTDKLKVLVDDARAMGLKLLPPDVNLGGWRFDPVDAHTIRYALGAIKGTGRAAIEAIVDARADRPFASLMDFAARVDRNRINRRVLEALIRAGAFDSIDPNRATLLAAVGMALEHAAQCAEHADQSGLFDSLFDEPGAAAAGAPEPEPQPPWDLRKRLSEEKLAIGFVLSGHLFDAHAAEVRRFAPRPLAELADAREPQIVAGIVAAVRVVQGQRGRVAIVTLEDRSGTLEAVVNDRLLDTVRALLRDDELLVMQGRAQNDRFSGGLRFNVDAVWTLEQTRVRLGRRIRMRVNGLADAGPLIDLARTHAAGEEGGLPLDVEVERGGAEATLRIDRLRLRPGDDVLAALRELAIEGRVQVVYEGSDSAAPMRAHS